MADGRCVVCGLSAPVPTAADDPLAICGATCVAEAEREIDRAVGRIHQLETLQDRAASARPWHILLHPSVRSDVREADVQIAELQARVQLLERSIATWHARRAQRRGTPLSLAPRTFPRRRAIDLAEEPAESTAGDER